jgi:hypothetical protein
VNLLAVALLLAISGPKDTEGHASVIVVVGAPGSKEYGARFTTWADRWKRAAAKAEARFSLLGTDDNPKQSDRQRFADTLAREAAETRGDLWLVLIGHGTFDGRTAKFNLRGSDVSSDELAAWLKPVHRPLVVIDAASASGPFLKTLSGPDRIIVTATRSGREQNATRLGGFVSEAIVDPAADLDKDGQTSLLEAFLVAAKRVEASFSEAGLVATEHALLDDNGDGLGTGAALYQGLRARKPDGDAAPDGLRAHQVHLLRSEPERALPPELRRRRDQLELEVLKLRESKAKLAEEEYYRRIETLLLEIAHIYQRAEARPK